MKKLLILLLFCFISLPFANDNLSDVVKNGELALQLHLVHDELNYDDSANDSYGTIAGIILNYKTKPYGGSFVNLTFGSNNPVFAQKNPQNSELLSQDEKSIDSLIEGYLYFQEDKHSFKLGKQQLYTPLLNSTNSRVLPYSFSGFSYMLRSDFLKVVLGSVNEQKRANERVFSSEFDGGNGENGIFFGGLELKNIGFESKAYYYQAKDMFDSIFFQVDKNGFLKTWRYYLGAQYITTGKNGSGKNINTLSNDGGSDVKINALRVGTGYKNAGLIVAYSKNNGSNGLAKAYAGKAELFTDSLIDFDITDGYEEIVSFRFKYDFSKELTSKIIYNDTSFKKQENPNNFDSLFVEMDYEYAKNSYFNVGYEHMDKEYKSSDIDYLRVVLTKRF
ncbi:MAG: hypothetical protein QG567_1899 [Campylobacterota bacterium]|nr:hypothetical protein [Campylobacterota bacterium]